MQRTPPPRSSLARHFVLTLALGALLPAHAGARPTHCGMQRWQPYIAHAARRFHIRERWLRAIVLVESSGCAARGRHPVRSRAGAMGLMQLEPITWRRFRRQLHLRRNPYDPRENILVGAAYLRELYQRFGPAGFLAAYNAGPGRYRQYVSEGRPLPPATLAYLRRLRAVLGSDPEPPLVADRAGPARGGGAVGAFSLIETFAAVDLAMQ